MVQGYLDKGFFIGDRFMSKMIPTAVIGATGYTGIELVRILLNHPNIKIVSAVSRQHAGKMLSEVYPAFTGRTELILEPLKIPTISRRVKLVFLCLPHHQAMDVAKGFRRHGVRVIDLSADFRIRNPEVYEKWYGSHSQKKLLSESVYGLPELYKKELKTAKLVASPGCYPTSIVLPLAPLLRKKMVLLNDIICDSKSGVTGAGRSVQVENLFSEVNEGCHAYKIGTHRHTPEIDQELSRLAGERVHVLFVPHLVPMDRGILSTIYLRPLRSWKVADVLDIYQAAYRRSPFVQILPEGQLPRTKSVRGTNVCQIGVAFEKETERLVIVSAIDNLTKGASGQAVQCMNHMYGWPEKRGLDFFSPLIP